MNSNSSKDGTPESAAPAEPFYQRQVRNLPRPTHELSLLAETEPVSALFLAESKCLD